jgi:hypothetical protein
MWASMNGAFMLMGDDNFFRDITGLNPEHFIEESLEAHLAASQTAAPHNGNNASRPSIGRKKRSVSAVRTSRARNNKNANSEEIAAPPPA